MPTARTRITQQHALQRPYFGGHDLRAFLVIGNGQQEAVNIICFLYCLCASVKRIVYTLYVQHNEKRSDEKVLVLTGSYLVF